MEHPHWLDEVDPSWTLFLDRDGVINKKLPADYVKHWEEFRFLDGVLDALKYFATVFPRIVIVTNQQGIGKGIMTDEQLEAIHHRMLSEIEGHDGRIDAIYYCPKLASENPVCRKPNTGMADQAKAAFPEINFQKSIIVGDSVSDMEFGANAGMRRVFVTRDDDSRIAEGKACADVVVANLAVFKSVLTSN